MATTERQIPDPDDSRRTVIIIVAVIAAVAIAGLFYVLMRSVGSGTTEVKLEGGIRAGSPEFEQYASKIVLDKPEAYQSKQALGGLVMNLQTVVHNFTGRTLSGLEITGIVVDHQGKPVNQHAAVVVPSARQPELENNRSMIVVVLLQGMTDKDDRADIKMEVSAIRFK
jgi:hypothetical protein